MTNNYNSNSAGTSIEINAFYDSDLSQIYFSESLQLLKDDLYFFTDCGNETEIDLDEVHILDEGLREEVIDYLLENTPKHLADQYNRAFFEKMNNSELKEELLMEGMDISDDFFCFDHVNFVEIETRGYSQGDYAKVIARKSEYTESKAFKDHIHNLFWVSPSKVYLDIDGIEIYCCEFLSSEYLYADDATKEILEHVQSHKGLNEKQKKAFVEFLSENPIIFKYS